MKQKLIYYRKMTLLFLTAFSLMVVSSCEKYFEFELPEANSKTDTVLPKADFSFAPDAKDFQTIIFKNLSFESTKYLWDFGGGKTSASQDPAFTFPGEGTYKVTLTSSDANGASNSITKDVRVVDLFVPLAPAILNGDFEAGAANWSFSSFTGGTTSPFNTSGDGSWLKYDGADNGAKTKGAKWTKETSAGAYKSSNTRYAYQAIVVSPNRKYILEYEYAIKTEAEQAGIAPGGNRIIGGILDGHFADGAEAISSYDKAPLLNHVGTKVLGKTVFTTVKGEFTANASGKVGILIYGVTDVDAYLDNVKVYPKK
ncbi:MAG: PKD domain-containing protein [Haliscomenobacter sp.]|nr:PKD domain-containing protein [Haliscomenobacter sp.]MBK8656892.1 PKD domain-containing protein [Haliscomenobacter sp.]